MAVFLKHDTGKVLLVNNKVATSSKCCCNQEVLTVTCDHPAVLPLNGGVYEVFTATLSPLKPGVVPTGSVTWTLNGAKMTGWPNPTSMHSDGTSHTPSGGIFSGNGPASGVWGAEYSGDSNYSPVNGSFTQTFGAGRPYHINFCPNLSPTVISGVQFTFGICAHTQAQALTSSCLLSCGTGCVDTSFNGTIGLVYQTFGTSVSGPTSVTLTAGKGTITMTAFGTQYTSFKIGTNDSVDGFSNSFCVFTIV